MTTLPAHDANGAPLAGLTPTWAVCVNATTGAVATQPSIVELGGGLYGVTAPDDVAGIVDFGASARPRYAVVHPATVTVVAAFGMAGAPLPGLAPMWLSWVALAGTGAALPQPTFTPLSGGLYRVDAPQEGAVGTIDFGPTTAPRYVTVGDELASGDGPTPDPIPPVVSNIDPPTGTRLTPMQPVSFDVTDDVALRSVIVYARFTGALAVEVVADNGDFKPLYQHGSSRTPIANGWRYTVMRLGGWRGAPSFTVRATDTSGNDT